jgi:hypothetical protein
MGLGPLLSVVLVCLQGQSQSFDEWTVWMSRIGRASSGGVSWSPRKEMPRRLTENRTRRQSPTRKAIMIEIIVWSVEYHSYLCMDGVKPYIGS